MSPTKLESQMWDLVVIGGGAAGFFAAVVLGSLRPLSRVAVLEGTNKFLSKVEVSGGGRCNVTQACFDSAELIKHYPRGEKELRGLFSRFQPRDTVHWFQDRGVDLKTEADGRMFPKTDSSKTIIDCLMREASEGEISLQLKQRVKKVEKIESGFKVTAKEGEIYIAKTVLMATGSSASGHELAQSLGHSITECAPSLFTFKIADPLLKELSGLSFPNAALKLTLTSGDNFTQVGPVLITHWGLSGPAVLKLSAWAARELKRSNYQAELTVLWDSALNNDSAKELLVRARKEHLAKHVSNYSPFEVPRRFWERAVEIAEIPADLTYANISNSQLDRLSKIILQTSLSVTGKGEFKEEFVTCGGISLKEVNFKTMESKICPGLYFAGEILDIDGETGGYNFQSAWSSGWHVAASIAGLEL